MAGSPEDSDSTIECAHCGEHFYYELTRCPNCGRPVFPDEELEEVYPASTFSGGEIFENLAQGLTAIVGILLGLIVSFTLGSLIFFGLRSLLGAAFFQGPLRILLLLSAPTGALAGGYLAAALEKNHPRSQGWWVGGLSILVAIALAAFERDLETEPFFTIETLPWWIAIVLAGFWGAEIWRRMQRNTVIRELFPDLPDEKELYKDLMAKIGHNKGQAERLIEYEKQYMPNANRRTLIESAIQRWERDNR